MKRSLDQAVPEVPLADGLRLVPFDMSMDETLRVTHNEVFLDHWGSTPKDEESWKIEVTGARAFRGGSSYLVLDGETIAVCARLRVGGRHQGHRDQGGALRRLSGDPAVAPRTRSGRTGTGEARCRRVRSC